MAEEQVCCAFLRFEVQEEKNGVRLTIRAPEEFRDSAEMLFDMFIGKQAADRRPGDATLASRQILAEALL